MPNTGAPCRLGDRGGEADPFVEVPGDSPSKNTRPSSVLPSHHGGTAGERPQPPSVGMPPAHSQTQSDLRLSSKVVKCPPSSPFSGAPLGIVSSGSRQCPGHKSGGAVTIQPKSLNSLNGSTSDEGNCTPKPDSRAQRTSPQRPCRPLSLRLPDPGTDVSSSSLSPFSGSPVAAQRLTPTGGTRSPSHARFINRHKYREKTPAVESATCFSFLDFVSRLLNLDSFVGEGLLGPVQCLTHRWRISPPCDMQRCRFPELLRVYRYRTFFFLLLACLSVVTRGWTSALTSMSFASLWIFIGAAMCCSKTYKWTSNLLTGLFSMCLVSTHPWLVSIRESLPFADSLHIFVGCALLLLLPQADQWVIPTHTRVLCHLGTTTLYVLSCVFFPPSSLTSPAVFVASLPSLYACVGALFWWTAHLLFYCSDFFLSEIFALSCMSEAEEASNFMVEQLFKCWSPGGINVVALTDKHRQCTWISKDAHQVFAPDQRGTGGSDRGAGDDGCGTGGGGRLGVGGGGWGGGPYHQGVDDAFAPSRLIKRATSYASSVPNSPSLSSASIKKSVPEVEIHSCSSSSFSPSNPSSFHLDSPSAEHSPSSEGSTRYPFGGSAYYANEILASTPDQDANSKKHRGNDHRFMWPYLLWKIRSLFTHGSPYPRYYHGSLERFYCLLRSSRSLFDPVVAQIYLVLRRLFSPHSLPPGQKPSASHSLIHHVHASKTEGERADAALIGLSLDSWIHPDDRAVFSAVFERADGDTAAAPDFHYPDSNTPKSKSPAGLLAELARRRLGAVAAAPSTRRDTTAAAGLLQEDGRCIVRVLRPSSRPPSDEKRTKERDHSISCYQHHRDHSGDQDQTSSNSSGDQNKGVGSALTRSHPHHEKARREDQEFEGDGHGQLPSCPPGSGGGAGGRGTARESYSDTDYLYYEVSVTPCRYPWTSSRVRLTRYNVSFYNIDERVRLQKQLESLVLAMSETLGIAAWAFDTHTSSSSSSTGQGDECERGQRGSRSHCGRREGGDCEGEEGSRVRSLSPSSALRAALGGLSVGREDDRRGGERLPGGGGGDSAKNTASYTSCFSPEGGCGGASSSSSPSMIPGYGSPSRYSYIFTEQAYKKMTGREISTAEQMRLFHGGSALWDHHANRLKHTRSGEDNRLKGDSEQKKERGPDNRLDQSGACRRGGEELRTSEKALDGVPMSVPEEGGGRWPRRRRCWWWRWRSLFVSTAWL